jgi:ferric-dicitrate binding protein FerR (iron transport regulator)
MQKEELKALFKKYHEGKCTEEEKALLEAWYLQHNEYGLDISHGRIKAIGNRIYRELPGNHTVFIKIGIRLAAAAVIIGIILTITLKLSLQKVKPINVAITTDIAPGKNIAILTLSNGTKINLSGAGNGQIANQAGIRIVKTASGQITYEKVDGSANASDAKSNSIAVPKGGQWQVVLPDGSKVWLNSATSFSYPLTFAKQKERIVQLTGEAYFEVAKDRLHPFIVKTDKQTVEVLGTHFNINSYPDEPSVKTALAEGRVKVSGNNGKTAILIPGQQAILTNGVITVAKADIEEALAWKNGYFRFNDENIESTMRKLSRWYNIDVQYGIGISTDGMNGKVSRYKNISQVLNALEATKTVHFKVEGRRVTVLK